MKTKICNVLSVLNLVQNDEHPNRVHDKKWLRQNGETVNERLRKPIKWFSVSLVNGDLKIKQLYITFISQIEKYFLRT